MRLSASASWGSSLAKLCSNGCTFFLGVSGMSACKWWSSVKNVYAHKYYVEYAPLTNPGIRKHDILYIDMSGQILCRSYTWAQTSAAEGSVSGLLKEAPWRTQIRSQKTIVLLCIYVLLGQQLQVQIQPHWTNRGLPKVAALGES